MTVVAVVLAAGAGRRLGGVAKALLALSDGRSYLAAVRDAARAAGAIDAVVVVGPPFDGPVRAAATALGLACVDNPTPERGMASSVALGFGYAVAAFAAARGALLWPVDHVRATGATARRVVEAGTADNIVVPAFGGRGGHPTWFGVTVWPELAACDGASDGARSVVRANPARVTRVDVADRGVVADVDTPETLA